MPRYDYQCPACHHTQEVTHGIDDSVALRCPDCKTQTLVRVISPVPSHFKGGGWASENYSKGAGK